MMQRLFYSFLVPALFLLAACQDYDFKVNDTAIYNTSDPVGGEVVGASPYTAAQHDGLVYYHITWTSGGPATTMTATVDNFGVGGTAPTAPLAITEIEYDSAAEPHPTVTLTWRKTGAATYIAWLTRDLSDWGEDLDEPHLRSGRCLGSGV